MTLLESDQHDDKLPEESGTGRTSLLVAKLAAAAIGAGVSLPAAALGGGLVLFENFIAPHLRARQTDFFNELADRVRLLEKRMEALDEAHIERFIDAAVTAAIAAAKTSDPVKREALLNAVTNSALKGASDGAQQEIFLKMIDGYTALHLSLLNMFHDPSRWQSPDGRSVDKRNAVQFVSSAFPGLRYELLQQAWADLFHDGLVNAPTIDNGPEGPTVPPRTTPYGRAFMDFIKAP